MKLSRFSKDSRLPCKLDEIITNVRKRRLQADRDDKVGLAKDVLAVPLNHGFVLCAKDTVLYTNEVEPLRYLDGSYTSTELVAKPGMQSALEQLFYYDLLSFNSNNGYFKEVRIDPKYAAKYQDGEFVTFSMVPLAVELNITNTCNFNCIHCSNDSRATSFPDELSTKEILAIIDGCLQFGVPELRFMGGEPLVHPGFFKFIQYAREKGIYQLRLSTNAWLIDDEKVRELAKYFDSIQISVHGASPSVHDHIVGRKGAWEQAKRAVRLLNKNSVKVNIGFTVMRENVKDLPKMPHLALEWEADSLGFLCLIPHGRGARLRSWSKEEIFEMGDTIKEMKCGLGSCLNLDVAGFPPINPLRKDNTVYGCEAGKTLMAIEPNGTVKACGILDEDLGINIKEKTLLEIWHSSQFIEMRRRLSCADCNYMQICWGPCRFLDNQDFTK